MMKKIYIHTDYIQLDQALKKEGIISTGGEIAPYLEMHRVLLSGAPVREKRKKLRPGDMLSLDGDDYLIEREK